MTRFVKGASSIRKIQGYVAEMYARRGYTQDLMTLALGLCEEAGEVGKAVNVYHNPLFVSLKITHADGLEHELCDAFVYLLAIANAAQLDLQSAMQSKLAAMEE